tara:strand:- start:434 stop:1429 length:996 start_codon:yes stop_codon:yes gene_type:complete
MADNPAMETAVQEQPTAEPEVKESLIGQFENLITAENELPTSEGEQEAKAEPEAPSDEPTPQDLELEEIDDNSPAEASEELYSVKVNGLEEKVNLNELLAGYSRQKDYSTKTNQLAEERKNLENERSKTQTEIEAVKIERDKYATQLKSFLKQDKEEDIDWDKAYNEDPIEYVRLKAESDRKKEIRQKAENELKSIEAKQKAETEDKYKQYVTSQSALLQEKVPEYADPVKGDKLKLGVKNYLNEIGFSDQELSMLTDHRTVMVAIEGMKYSQLKKAKLDGKKVNKVPKVNKGGVPTSKQDVNVEQRNSSLKRAKSGKSQDMLDAFMNVIN